MKDKYLCDNKCLYVEKTTYSKDIKTKKWRPLAAILLEDNFFFVEVKFIFGKNHKYIKKWSGKNGY